MLITYARLRAMPDDELLRWRRMRRSEVEAVIDVPEASEPLLTTMRVAELEVPEARGRRVARKERKGRR